MNNYKNLHAWQQSRDLAIMIYSVTNYFPIKENYGLTSQANRAAVSVAANLAEGSSRQSTRDFCHFVDIALGSLFELETLIEIAHSQKYLSDPQKLEIDSKITDVTKLMRGLKRSLKSSVNS